MTQEMLAEVMGVSRQTVSKWESGEACPDLGKLVELCRLFSCDLDTLVRKSLQGQDGTAVQLVTVPAFSMAKYVVISPDPMTDVALHLKDWRTKTGLDFLWEQEPVPIGWSFPYVSQEQKGHFGLRGYGGAYVLPEGFSALCPGVEYASQDACTYALLQLSDPFAEPGRISRAFEYMHEYLRIHRIPKTPREGSLPYFERHYELYGIPQMDMLIQCRGKAETIYQLT